MKRTMNFSSILIVSFAYIISLFTLRNKPENELFHCSKQLEDCYGVCSHVTNRNRNDFQLREREFEMMNDLQTNIVRTDIYWWKFPKDYSTSSHDLDSLFVTARQHSISTLGILEYRNSSEFNAWDDLNEYGRFLDYTLKYYGYDIKYWEVINEIDRLKNISQDSLATVYPDILKLCYKKIKKHDKSNIVVMGSITKPKEGLLEKLCKSGCAKYCDVFNFHSYDTPENNIKFYKDIKRIFDKTNVYPKVWLTECGIHTALDRDLNKPQFSEEEQARRIPRTHLIAFAYGIDKVFVYNLKSTERDKYDPEDNFGILHSDLTPKPAYYSYKQLIKMLPCGSTRPKLRINNDTYICEWVRPDKVKVHAIWKTGSEKNVSFKAEGHFFIEDLYGEKVSVDNPIKISTELIYIIGTDKISISNFNL